MYGMLVVRHLPSHDTGVELSSLFPTNVSITLKGTCGMAFVV